MAIKTVTALINGQRYTLTNSSGNTWTATVTAPGQTSYNQPGGYYNVTVTATNTAGTSATATASDLTGLQFVVKETVAPVITITSPTAGAYIANADAPIIGTVVDEQGGSGVKQSSIQVSVDGTPITNISFQSIANGVQFTATPSTSYTNGSHTATVSAQDNDGNSATQASVTFTVDTIPPTLNVTSPTDNFITNEGTVMVTGTTNDETSSPVTITITNNSVDQGAVSVNSGAFSKQITLTEGQNVIVVTATDRAGKTTSVTRTVTYDSSVPQITAASIVPNPADAGATVVITVTVEG